MSSSEEKEPYDIPSAPPHNFEKLHKKECVKEYLVKNKWMNSHEDLTPKKLNLLRTALEMSKALGEHPSKIPAILYDCEEKKRKELFDKLLKRGGKTRRRRQKVKGTRRKKSKRKPRKGKKSRKPRTSKKRG